MWQLSVPTAPDSLSLRRKVATDNMLQIIEPHPNWPTHADVFELASRRPVWSDMAPVDTTTQWREVFSKVLYCWEAYEICYKNHALPTSLSACCYTTLGN